MAEDVLVIGAGPAGLASAYYLEQAGLSYRVIDGASVIGSTWSNLYPSLRLNTTRFYSHLPGQRLPAGCGMFPSGKAYHAYLTAYEQAHNFNIHLGVVVHRLYPDGDGWRAETSEGSAWYPAVISATGRFCRPYLPHIPGMEQFQGQLLHARDYTGPEPFAGRRAIVVGNGPSGVDISTELGRYAAQPVLLSQRTGIVLRPRYPWGLPKHIWVLIADVLPGFVGQPLMRRIESLKFERLDEIGIKVPRTEAESTAAGGTRGHELIAAVKAGRVKSVDGPARFEAHAVVLDDGSRCEVDAVIMATGYEPALYNYLDLDVARNRDGWPMRVDEQPDDVTSGKRQVRDYPGLYLVGTFYQGKGALYNINIEAQQAVKEIRAHLETVGSEAHSATSN